jgi:hypothetical protein
VVPVKALAHGIERTCPDVAVNDPETGETEETELSLAPMGDRMRRRNVSRTRSS